MSNLTAPTRFRIGFAAMLSLFFLAISQTPSAAQFKQNFQEGRDYGVIRSALATSDPNKIEITYLFSYRYPASYHNDPIVQHWIARLPDDVSLIYMPVAWSDSMALDRQLFYTLQTMGLLHQFHRTVFDAHHQQKQRVATIDQWANLLGQHGVDKQQFLRAANSFSVRGMAQQAEQFIRAAGIRSLPSIVVNGRYLVNMPNLENALQVTEYLVSKIRNDPHNQ